MPESPLPTLVLASTSPRRRDLLAEAGFAFQVEAPGVGEEFNPSEYSGPRSIVEALALRKAQAVARRRPGVVVLGADTMVEAEDGTLMGTPADRAEAASMLRRLSGVSHRVHTGLALVQDDLVIRGAETAIVTFRRLEEEAILAYLATGEADDKAGAYGFQGEGGKLVLRVDGDPQTVIGLPVARVRSMLEELAAMRRSR